MMTNPKVWNARASMPMVPHAKVSNPMKRNPRISPHMSPSVTSPRSLLSLPWLLSLATVWLNAATPAGLGAQAGTKPGQVQRIERRHAVTGDVYFRLAGSVGRLQVTGWAKDSLVVTGSLPAGVRLEMGIGGDGRTPARGVKAFVESANDALASSGVLEIRVPQNARVWLKAGTAQVEVRDVTGGVDVNLVGGDVRVYGSPRELQVEAMDAAVAIEGNPAWCRAKTAAGDITLRGGSSDLALTSVSGTLRVEGGAVERGRLETVTGAIHFGATAANAGVITFDSHSGPIDVRLPASDDFAFLASSITGTVQNAYDRTRTMPGREGRGAELSIERGNASIRLTARTFKGAISARR
jgi:hypothetical protein